MERLFQKQVKGRDWTINVNESTYKIISEVAKETGNSRPKVLEAFVEEAYKIYQNMSQDDVLRKRKCS
jgi:Leu/Phe-tRNA-protein transferase